MTNSYNQRLRVGLDLQQPTGVWTYRFAYDTAKRLTNSSAVAHCEMPGASTSK